MEQTYCISIITSDHNQSRDYWKPVDINQDKLEALKILKDYADKGETCKLDVIYYREGGTPNI